uniref:MATH domain-containing protein n=1 Tax=Denticeps clupeoides TaxID=299321 RepID=A0AAY4EGG6_9TELE
TCERFEFSRQVDKYSYVWTISSFSFADDVNGVPIMSSTISNPSGDLCLQLFPNGVEPDYESYLSFYLVLVRGVRVSCKLAMLNAEGQEEFSLGKFTLFMIVYYFNAGLQRCDDLSVCFCVTVNQYDTRMYENDKLGFPDFVHRSDILDDDLGFLKDDTLTLTCELWDTSLHSDCILSVAGQEFKAHKAILAGNTVATAHLQVIALCVTLSLSSPQHCLDHLKLICEDALCSRLDVASAAENLILGDLYRARHLKQDALTFINFNAEAVMKTNGWMIPTQDHPNLIVDLYSSLAEASEPPVKHQRLF